MITSIPGPQINKNSDNVLAHSLFSLKYIPHNDTDYNKIYTAMQMHLSVEALV